ncbi:uroporphyrinogen decarboxylase [Porphyromonadaceae bacterium NLAE-zl-C104]|jgi:uroporphyrinogen decarboxylase|uniref:uroporphyrinogen decarboxylase family protein n=1 Tax=Proteiniphilum sp. X52 TaxID=2382159 RepID=UPI0008951EA4|nr:uroporphyrinogen decarboxylase [Porphyromonadaceae bacterium KH3R12]SFS71241.1 uroporphyrinogen decarboxylase [Porphyromonadaceae bacterium NLAE-zl-C104]SFU56022.1 uroporphyrinogen decarboxylase [Porphyromonadaceae bacterium KHP3R9]
MKEWIDSVLNHKRRQAFPLITHPGIELMGATVKSAVSDGRVQYEAIRAASETFHLSTCSSMMDLTVEAEAFGAKVNMPEDETPRVVGRLLKEMSDVEQLQVPALDQGRLPAYLLANQLCVSNIKERTLFSGCIGPFSLAGRLYDMSEIMVSIYTEPETILLLLSKCSAFLVDYCKAMKSTGTAGVIMAEPAAGLLSDEDCRLYSSDFVKQIVQEVQDDNFTVILHNCGNSGQCTQAMIESGANALHFGNAIDITEALSECPPHLIVMGNLDPVSLFKQSNPDQVKQSTLELLNRTKNYPNFVISSGCDLPPQTPLENIRAFLEAVEEFNRSI